MTIPELYELFIHNPKVTTDSRNCPRGSIFFALKGDKFDGNQYAEKALASGCVYAVIHNPDYFIGDFKQNLKVKYHWVTKSIFLSLHGR